jgi:hypothetical protein
VDSTHVTHTHTTCGAGRRGRLRPPGARYRAHRGAEGPVAAAAADAGPLPRPACRPRRLPPPPWRRLGSAPLGDPWPPPPLLVRAAARTGARQGMPGGSCGCCLGPSTRLRRPLCTTSGSTPQAQSAEGSLFLCAAAGAREYTSHCRGRRALGPPRACAAVLISSALKSWLLKAATRGKCQRASKQAGLGLSQSARVTL